MNLNLLSPDFDPRKLYSFVEPERKRNAEALSATSWSSPKKPRVLPSDSSEKEVALEALSSLSDPIFPENDLKGKVQEIEPQEENTPPYLSLCQEVLEEPQMLDVNQGLEHFFLLRRSFIFINSFIPFGQLLNKVNMYKMTFEEILWGIRDLSYHASRFFKKEFLMCHLSTIAQEWGLTGTATICNREKRLEGNEIPNMHAYMAASLESYFSQKKPPYLNFLTEEDKAKILESFQKAINCSSEPTMTNARDVVRDYWAGKMVTIGTGWHRHAVEIILYKGFLIYLNRGNDLEEEDNTYLKVYRLNPAAVTAKNVYQLFLTEKKDKSDWEKIQMEYFESETGDMVRTFNLQLIDVVLKKKQKAKNCTFASAKGGFHGQLILLLMEKALNGKQKPLEVVLHHIEEYAEEIYKNWEVFSRQQALSNLLQLKDKIKEGSLPLHPYAYFTILKQIEEKLETKTRLMTDGSVAYHRMDDQLKRELAQLPLSISDCEQCHSNHEISLISQELQKGKSGHFVILHSNEDHQRLLLYKDVSQRCILTPIPSQCQYLDEVLQLFPACKHPYTNHFSYRKLRANFIKQRNIALEPQLTSEHLFFPNEVDALKAVGRLQPGQFALFKRSPKHYVLLIKNHVDVIQGLEISANLDLKQQLAVEVLNERIFYEVLSPEQVFPTKERAVAALREVTNGFAVIQTAKDVYECIYKSGDKSFLQFLPLDPSKNLFAELRDVLNEVGAS